MKAKSQGIAGHQSPIMGKDEWLTPQWVLKKLPKFDLDPCAPAATVRPWATADRHICLPEDGLTAPWEGRVWCNPPYGKACGAWLERCADHGDAIAFVFARTDTAAWQRHVFGRAHGILFLSGRVTFHHVSGLAAKHNGGAPSALIAYGAFNAVTLERCGIPGHFVRP